MVKLPIMMYVREVLLRLLPTIAICFASSSLFLIVIEEGFIRLVLITLLNLIITSITVYFIGLERSEKTYFKTLLSKLPILKRNLI